MLSLVKTTDNLFEKSINGVWLNICVRVRVFGGDGGGVVVDVVVYL